MQIGVALYLAGGGSLLPSLGVCTSLDLHAWSARGQRWGGAESDGPRVSRRTSETWHHLRKNIQAPFCPRHPRPPLVLPQPPPRLVKWQNLCPLHKGTVCRTGPSTGVKCANRLLVHQGKGGRRGHIARAGKICRCLGRRGERWVWKDARSRRHSSLTAER